MEEWREVERGLDRLGAPAWAKDPDGAYLAVGRGLAGYLGAPREPMAGRRQERYWPAAEVARFRADDHAVLVRRRPLLVPEHAADGPLVTLKVPLFGSDGALRGTLGAFVPSEPGGWRTAAGRLRDRVRDLLSAPLDRAGAKLPALPDDAGLPCPGAPLADPELPDWLEEVRRTVLQRFRERWTVAELAQAAGVHPSHLGRAFRTAFGAGIHHHRNRLRVEWACVELLRTERTAADVAHAAGFADQSHFTRVFRAHMDVPPGAYRRGAPPARPLTPSWC